MKKIIPIIPLGKPRMTQRDKWAKRPCVMRYRAFADELRLKVGKLPDDPIRVQFVAYLPIPKSWSEKKKMLNRGCHHRQKPDIDNIGKAIMDALLKDDSGIASCEMVKYWDDGLGPRLILEIT